MEGYDKSCSICVATKGKGIGECPICKLASNVGTLSAKVRRFSEGRFSGLGEEHPHGCWVKAEDFDRVTAERDALQQLLTARDEEVERVKHIARCNISAVHEFLGNTEHHDDYKRDMAELENQA